MTLFSSREDVLVFQGFELGARSKHNGLSMLIGLLPSMLIQGARHDLWTCSGIVDESLVKEFSVAAVSLLTIFCFWVLSEGMPVQTSGLSGGTFGVLPVI